MNMTEILNLKNVGKDFALHSQNGANIRVFDNVDLKLRQGETLALSGPSGAGKSSLMRMIYGNYHCERGGILVRHRGEWVDIATAPPRVILDIRQHTIGYISQFLRVIPRVATLDIVAEPLRVRGVDAKLALERAKNLLARLNIPETLWALSPVTFSGGEQQRINIARGFIADYPILLLDEPTASLDPDNRDIVIELIKDATNKGTLVIGIFHDPAVRNEICDRTFNIPLFKAAC